MVDLCRFTGIESCILYNSIIFSLVSQVEKICLVEILYIFSLIRLKNSPIGCDYGIILYY